MGTSGGDERPGAGRTRWIALVAGFAALIAVIAVQHFAGGSPAASSSNTPPTGTTSSTSIAPTAPSPPSHASTAGTAPSATSRDATGPSATMAANSRAANSAALSRHDRGAGPSGGPDGTTTDAPTSSADTASPTTRTIATHLLPDAGNWELVGYGVAGVIRYQPATGEVTVTPVPRIPNGNVLSFVATRSAVIIRSMDNVHGYLVPDGRPARPPAGLLQPGGRVLPGPDPEHLWVVESDPDIESGVGTTLVLVDVHGRRTGPTIAVPTGLGVPGGYSVTSDGAGYALISGLGGVYDARPGGVRLVTHGEVVAAGPTAFLVQDCDAAARCSAAVIDRASGDRRILDGLTLPAPLLGSRGVISADARDAAVIGLGPGGAQIRLIDLDTGRVRTPDVDVGAGLGTGVASTLAFSPNGRYLLVAGMIGITPVHTRTGALLDPLPIPSMRAMTIRPGH